MPRRGPCTFKQQDVTRLLRATIAAGVGVQRVEIDKNGRIVLVTKSSTSPREEVDELDRELAEFEAKHGEN